MPLSLPVISTEVRQALDAGRPVVALESTIITHGLPRPRNLAVARDAERQLRDAGVVPATIGVVAGTPTVGLTGEQIEELAADEAAVKISTRDLPVAVARGASGGTTVAATAFLARKAGIRVFATGGLGGVHHGAATTFDESADLVTLASTPLVLVSAGAKSILDLAATLERLETLNIPVVGYRTRRFPGFYVADSGHDLEHSVDTPQEVAALVEARDALELRSALLVANPIPPERQLDPELHRRVLAEAWEEAERQGISGHDSTPFLLDHIRRATGDRSLEVNIDVYQNNVALGASIARAMAG
ncbi:pseudouridine-5'-phosphate glycosidase [Saccharopolyspora erythraea NRRL 2338]|uniref:Pseudouridine-5'-phosphate glycosidase n=2 Tax=Saccharopolyspora erythraea TaxID=1836 RepID=PSUG_SACEN|nr:pseudouridine-5'-phosphate glycosidase [Saccharopolyspora erythraea]A4F929.1 RecName: Full=Pseudouridine-5'-phosphate glycosidase; Short=PsiMP glycosidase [Saccharopolyspora erythraea NRRL 2338]EQD87197.1 pseudouridine-5'-phosphate glycosidase [Saccharopolyspora erythraea D]PFG94347.1 pseudouridine-5'-phosphate glycosidase [Saccharopolyspora erythraea NRRL 2338]QRK91118.1 pseudouridine-5'-phosphate glycosidase [Saccharopolyspora erythraea]CAM00554.1 pigment biosynthetic protein [Saccharopol